MVVGILIAAGVSALITGISSYIAFRPSGNNIKNTTIEPTATIKNDVNIEEKPDLLGTTAIVLLFVLVICKIMELIIVATNSYQRAMKKKYSRLSFVKLPATPVATITPPTEV